MNRNPLVSVIIPTYNCAPYIAEAIESVLAQGYRNFEIIVVDDGSTDNTRVVLGPYWERIIYLEQVNQGVVAARNVGIEYARGELIAFLDADDVWFPRKLALQIQAYQQYPEAGLAFTDCSYFDESHAVDGSLFSKRVRRWFNSHRDEAGAVAHGWLYKELLQSNCMHTSSVLVRRDVLDKVGLFNGDFKICQDYDLWLRIARKYPVVCINSVLCGYRYRRDSLSGPAEVREFRYNHEWIEVLEKHLKMDWIPENLQSLAKDALCERYWWLGWRYFYKNRFKEARSLFFHGLRYRPFSRRHWLYVSACFLPLPVVENLRRLKRGSRLRCGVDDAK